jgi:hypothetical protein
MRKISELVSMMMILTILFGILPAYAAYPTDPTQAHDGNSMWVEPDKIFNTATTNVGDKFNVTVYANITSFPSNPNGIGGWQFKLVYDNTWLNATRCWYKVGTAAGQSEFLQDIVVKTVSPVFGANSVLHGEAWNGDPVLGPFATTPRVGGCSIVEFNITAAPPKNGKLTSSLDISTKWPSDTYVAGYDTVNDILNNVYNANAEYDWTTPASPNIDITPASRTFGPFDNVVGTTFTEDITIRSLSQAWYIVNASMKLHYDHTPNILGVRAVAFGAGWNVATTFDNTTYGVLGINVTTNAVSPPLSGNVLVATVTFEIIYQGVTPETNTVPLTLSDVELWDHTIRIPVGTTGSASITVKGLIAAPLPWLELKPHSQTFGPNPVVGTTFSIDVWIMNLTNFWRLVGLQYRISYNATYFAVVDVTEGPYIPSFNATYPPPYTWFQGYDMPDTYGPHVLVGELILPNSTGYWPTNSTAYPGATPPDVEDGLIATMTFEIIKQDVTWPPTTTILPFNIIETLLIDDNANDILTHDPVNATVTIIGTPEIGRDLDEYGGASNSGLWAGYPNPFPAPYGGQGHGVPMDLVEPQSEITFYASVTYNDWPVQSKDVGFELEGPFEKNESDPTQLIPKQTCKIWFKLTARTDTDGIARITVRMPWPCVDPESITGVYVETSTVQLADVTLSDELPFYYQHMVYITKVTATPYYVYHDESIKVCVEYETHAMQTYPVLFAAVLQDELGVPFGMALFNTTFGGAQWCTWTTGKFCVDVYVPKWAYSGFAYVHVSAYNKDPTIGGFSYGMEYTPLPEVYILPAIPPTVYVTPASATWNMTKGVPITFTAHVSGGVPPYTYKWYMDGFLQPGTVNTFTIYSWAAGTHTVSVAITDYFGRTATGIVTLIVIA